MNEYSEKLKDPRWQKRRLQIMERDGFTCVYCGQKESTLHVHHLGYDRNKDPWDYEDERLITLCEKSHKNLEHILRALQLEMGDQSVALCAYYVVGLSMIGSARLAQDILAAVFHNRFKADGAKCPRVREFLSGMTDGPDDYTG